MREAWNVWALEPERRRRRAAALIWGWYAVMLGLFVLALWVGRASAHGPAQWIADKAPECCGEIDCEAVDQARVLFTPAGWRVRGFTGTVPVEDVRPSDPGKGPWVCRFLVPVERPPIRCLFLPGARN